MLLGTWNNALIEKDFTKADLADFMLSREILFESDSFTQVEQREKILIIQHGANDPDYGYNRVPHLRTENGA